MVKNILKVFAGVVVFLNIATGNAADIHHFEVTANPTEISIGEAIDLTVEAVDSDNNVIKDYEGTILIFSESDKKAEFPNNIEDNSYTFTKSDEGIVKFENAIRFTKEGKNDIHIYDLGDDTDSVFGLVEIQVNEKKVEKNIDIEILSPENGLIIGNKKITVSGKSTKNHQIKIVLNNKEETLTTTNRDGIFEKEISGLEDGENVFKAYVLNSDGKEIGFSKEVIIKSDLTSPILNKLKIIPGLEVEVNSRLSAEVYASKGLSEVSILLNDGINILKEDTEGVYKGEFLAPKVEGEYKIDVVLKNELGNNTIEKDKERLKVTPELDSAGEKLKKDKCIDGDFTGDVFDGECGEKPEDYNAPLDLGIKNLKLVQLKTKSILTWNKLDDAIKYEIYKKMSGGELELVDTVKEPRYEILIIGDTVKYEYFAVKAIGKEEFVDTEDETKTIEKEVRGDLSDAIKIQTGPKEILIIIIALILGFGAVILFNRKQKV